MPIKANFDQTGQKVVETGRNVIKVEKGSTILYKKSVGLFK